MKRTICMLISCALLCAGCAEKSEPAAAVPEESTTQEQNTESFWNESKSESAVASITDPASVGEWLDSCRYSNTDDAYHTINYRITSVSRDASTVTPALEAYAASHPETSLPSTDATNESYVLIQYQVEFPEDFPENTDGITDADLIFNVVISAADANARTNTDIMEYDDRSYRVLSNVYDISDEPATGSLHAGDTWEGAAAFILENDVEDFLIRYSYYLNGNAVDSYVHATFSQE